MPHRLTRRALALTALLLPLTGAAFPDRPIEWVVPYPAGGGTDVVARTLAERMAPALRQAIVVVNKPGAATNIGADYAAKAGADGHVVLSADTATLAANPFLYARLPYDAERDFAPVGLMARFPLILAVHPSVPARTLPEFVAWAKAQPHPVAFATPGAGSPHHLATELLRERTGLALNHVPYRGAAPAVQDVLGGQVPLMFVDTAIGLPHLQSGRLVALGVASPQRLADVDAVRTLAEQGLPGFEAYAWQGLVVPAGTPQPTVDQLNRALVAALDSAEVRARFRTLGLEATPGTPQQMADYARAERAKWGAVIRAGRIKVE